MRRKPVKGKGQYLKHPFLARFKGKGELFRGCFPIIPGAVYKCKSLGFDDENKYLWFSVETVNLPDSFQTTAAKYLTLLSGLKKIKIPYRSFELFKANWEIIEQYY